MVMSRIMDTLFVGSEHDSLDPQQLEANKITHIVRIDDEPDKSDRCLGIIYYPVEAYDKREYNIRQHFPGVNEFVHKARLNGGVVLIHCFVGVSRSVTITTAYLMTVTTFGHDDVLDVIQHCRKEASPNLGFLDQLGTFEKENLADERRRIREVCSLAEGADPLGDDAQIKVRLAILKEKTKFLFY